MKDPSGRNAITKTYQFTDFGQAWEWMKKVAVLAEEINHHPEWKNIYNIVEVTLSTHDCGGVSELVRCECVNTLHETETLQNSIFLQVSCVNALIRT
jgi:4a-hydroxytetrahydrobiopterin dehydratase